MEQNYKSLILLSELHQCWKITMLEDRVKITRRDLSYCRYG